MLQTRYNVDQLLLNKALLANPSHSNINIYILMTFIFELRVTLLGETSSQSFLGLNDLTKKLEQTRNDLIRLVARGVSSNYNVKTVANVSFNSPLKKQYSRRVNFCSKAILKNPDLPTLQFAFLYGAYDNKRKEAGQRKWLTIYLLSFSYLRRIIFRKFVRVVGKISVEINWYDQKVLTAHRVL